MPPPPRVRKRAIRTTPSSTSMSPMSRCRRSAAACSATTATIGWPAGSSRVSRRSSSPGSGRYSFKGAAYVRGGIFDRIELIQDTNSIRFRDRDHTRLGKPCGRRRAGFSRNCAVRACRRTSRFDPTEPWVLQLLVQRVVGARDKAWLTFDLGYTLPDATSSASRTRSAAAAPPRRPAASPKRRRPRQRDARHASPPKTSRCG